MKPRRHALGAFQYRALARKQRLNGVHHESHANGLAVIGWNHQKSFGARDDRWREANELGVVKDGKARQDGDAEPRVPRSARRP